MDDLLEKLLNIPNVLLESHGEMVIPDAMSKAHYKDVLRGVWWYRLSDGFLDYSKTAKSHMDDCFVASESPRGWVRGRVGDDNGKVFCFIYVCDFTKGAMPGRVLYDIFKKVKQASGLPIEYFTDEDGYSLLEKRK